MVKEVITAMAISVRDFTGNLSLLAILGLGIFLLVLVGIMVFLGHKLRKVRKDKQKVIELKKHAVIEKHHEDEEKKIKEVRKQKANAIRMERHRHDIRNDSLNWGEFDEGQKQLFGQAVAVVHDARRGGFSELEIRNMFLERGWREQDIQKLLKE